MRKLLAIAAAWAVLTFVGVAKAQVTLQPLSGLTPRGTAAATDKIPVAPVGAPNLESVQVSDLATYFSTIYLSGANNLSELTSASSARANLGLGNAAVASTGGSGHVLGYLDGNLAFSGDLTVAPAGGIPAVFTGATGIDARVQRNGGQPGFYCDRTDQLIAGASGTACEIVFTATNDYSPTLIPYGVINVIATNHAAGFEQAVMDFAVEEPGQETNSADTNSTFTAGTGYVVNEVVTMTPTGGNANLANAVTVKVGTVGGSGQVTSFVATSGGLFPPSTAAFTGAISGTTLTLSGAPSSGAVVNGATVYGVGVTAGTVITGGSGLSWTVNNSQSILAEAMTTSLANLPTAFTQASTTGVGTGFGITAPSWLANQPIPGAQLAATGFSVLQNGALWMGTSKAIDGSNNGTFANLTASGKITLPSVAQSAAAWSSNGLVLAGGSAVLTDTTSSGAVSGVTAPAAIGNYTLAASNSSTYANMATLYLGIPQAGTHVTITSAWSLWAAGGINSAGLIQATTGFLANNAGTVGFGSAALSFDSASTLDVGNGTSGNTNGTLKLTSVVHPSTTGVESWNSDTGLSRGAAGVVDVGNGTAADFSGSLKLTSLNVQGLTASLPICTDASKNTTSTCPAIALSALATQAANTVVANVTSGSAAPTAAALPSCSTSASALSYTPASGFGCNTAVNAATLNGATMAAPGAIGGTTPAPVTGTTITGSTINDSGLTASVPACTDASKNLSSSCNGLVTNAILATAGANTVKANATGSTAADTDFSMPSCSATDNRLKWTAGTGFACDSAALATTNAAPSNPTGTTSTTKVMAGLAGSITPTRTGRVMITIRGDMSNGTAADGCVVQISHGTGTAPINGAALTGTQDGATQTNVSTSGQPFSVSYVITGLTVSTAYWLDLDFAALTGGTCSPTSIEISAAEI